MLPILLQRYSSVANSAKSSYLAVPNVKTRMNARPVVTDTTLKIRDAAVVEPKCLIASSAPQGPNAQDDTGDLDLLVSLTTYLQPRLKSKICSSLVPLLDFLNLPNPACFCFILFF